MNATHPHIFPNYRIDLRLPLSYLLNSSFPFHSVPSSLHKASVNEGKVKVSVANGPAGSHKILKASLSTCSHRQCRPAGTLWSFCSEISILFSITSPLASFSSAASHCYCTTVFHACGLQASLYLPWLRVPYYSSSFACCFLDYFYCNLNGVLEFIYGIIVAGIYIMRGLPSRKCRIVIFVPVIIFTPTNELISCSSIFTYNKENLVCCETQVPLLVHFPHVTWFS